MTTTKSKGLKRKKESAQSERDTEEQDLEHEKREKRVKWDEVLEKETATEDEDNENSEADDNICLAVSCQNGRIGGAYYDPIKGTVFVVEDTQETNHFDFMDTVLDQASPSVVLTSSRSDDEFIDKLHDSMTASGGILQIRPFKDFTPTKGRDRLLSLRMLSELPTNAEEFTSSEAGSQQETGNLDAFVMRRQVDTGDPTLKRWNALIRLANFTSVDSAPLCLASIGALLDCLVRQRAVGDLHDSGVAELEVRNIELLSLNQFMQINNDALLSLQIFENESHASIHSDKTKEGLSLFGILNNTKTTLGRSLLRTWLTRPSLNISVINARHDAVACFVHPENLITANTMHNHLKGIRNIPRTMGVMRAGKARVSDWQGLVKFTFHSAMLRDALVELHHAVDVPIVKKLISALDVASFMEIGNAVNGTIDWEESANTGRVCVRPHIDDELDDRKHIYNGIDSILSTVAGQVSSILPEEVNIPSLNVVYFPQLGFLICVPMLEEWTTETGIPPLEGWTFQFSSEMNVYFKSQEMRDMDVHIGDLHTLIVDREIEIIEELLDKILEFDGAMGKACDVCAELDCLLSLAEASRMNDYCRPQMVEKSVVLIKGGRHPLLEQVVDAFIPNDAVIAHYHEASQSFLDELDGCDCNNIIVCTGANACGKSVYLKQVALIQFMAQVGCFVPAEAATLGIVDKIFTRISTRESVSKVQSTFMIDLNQVSLALRNATPRSLIILDEFGKGTVSSDGAGLLYGVLRSLINRGADCPKVLVASHFHDIFRDDILDPRTVPVTFLHMEILLSVSEDGSESASDASMNGKRRAGGITYLFRVAPGLALESHAAQCAEMFGISQNVVDRASYVSYLLNIHEIVRLLDEELTIEDKEDLHAAEQVCRNFLSWNTEDGVNGSVRQKLAQIVGRDNEETQ